MYGVIVFGLLFKGGHFLMTIMGQHVNCPIISSITLKSIKIDDLTKVEKSYPI
jgi:hypothetical protein